MSKVQELIDSGFITENPDNANEILWPVVTRIRKDKIEAGGFEMVAAYAGWGEGHELAAPQFCAEQIKAYIRSMNAVALNQMLEAQKQAQLAALTAED